MLAEFGLIPDILDASTYPSPEICDLRLAMLKERLLRHGLVRDFRAGEWRDYLSQHSERWDKRGGELIKKLVTQKRLIQSAPMLPTAPVTDLEWCCEALASHRRTPLTGIVVSSRTAQQLESDPAVSSIERLQTAAWWNEECESVRLPRCTQNYLDHLKLVLKHANLLMFIDPHLDPTRSNYAEFETLVAAAERKDAPQPRIQIHRVWYVGHGAEREFPGLEHWRTAFEGLDQRLGRAGLTATVYFWDDFHDRYLISDLIGILMSNGFDRSNNPNEFTTWAQISRSDRQNVQREFDHPNNAFHMLHGSFKVGSGT